MDTDGRTQTSDDELEQELRSTLAALDELGPAYEKELAATLRERLRHFSGPPLRSDTNERATGWGWLFLPLAVGVLLTGSAFMSTVVRPSPASWADGGDHEWQYQSIGGADTAPVPPAALPAPSAVPGNN